MSYQYNESAMNKSNLNATNGGNATLNTSDLYPSYLLIPFTIIYAIIFVTGVIGNVSTCIVISRNKSMHTATNYYLFSLAISDMLLLVSGLPPEMYRIWSPDIYVFGEVFCVLQGFAAETSANATVLTITAFTVERYLAICHPFVSHKMSKLSRAIRFIVTIWIIALGLAVPQAIQFGILYDNQTVRCTVVREIVYPNAFEISTFLFFVGPMTLITVLYVLIGVQLRKSRGMSVPKRPSTCSGTNGEINGRIRNNAAQKRVINMLIAVVVAFFLCWAPFHAQRLLAVYLTKATDTAKEATFPIYMMLMDASGILYFLSTTINPVLYNIMSNKFREAFKKTLPELCRSQRQRSSSRTYSVLSKCHPSVRNFHGSTSVATSKPTSERCDLKNNLELRQQNSIENIRNENLSTLSKDIPEQNGNCVNNYKLHQYRSRLSHQKRHHPNNEKYLGVIRSKMFRLFHKRNNHFNNQFFRQNSVDSSNTISNSSLQDVDEIDYSSSDLVKYMEEINEDIA